MERCKSLQLSSDNFYSKFTETISEVLDAGPCYGLTWRKIVIFFSFAVSFGVYLCTNGMSHLAAQVRVWATRILQDRLQPWIDDQGGWVSITLALFIVL